MLWSDFKIKYAVDRFGEQRLNRQLASNETNLQEKGTFFLLLIFCVTGDLTCFENSLHHLTYG